jgi:hypothetical protein
MDDDEHFLSRWSRRKIEARRFALAAAQATVPEAPPTHASDEQAEDGTDAATAEPAESSGNH